MKNMKIRTQMILGFSIIGVLIIFIGISGINTLNKALAGEVTEKYLERGQIAIAVSVAAALLICFIIGYQIQSRIYRSVKVLRKASQQLTQGDVKVELTKYGTDEFGELIDDFARLADNIKYQSKLAENLAKGDLDIEVKTQGEQDILGNAFLNIIRENNALLSNIRETTLQINMGAEQVADASQALAQGSTEQASAIQQVTASMNEIADRTKANADQANAANDLIKSIEKEAGAGDRQMQEMIGAMTQINESSENISKIIKVIDDIAFQTNILALNAAVEAARAGVHGKGFAVVAEEVRNLAGKSASAASETAEMIEDSIKKVEHGSRLAQDTADSLTEIMESIEKIVALISSIAAASNDQAVVVTQIDQAIAQVSLVVQTNSATSEQCAAASEELSNQAGNLRSLIGNYKLKASAMQQ